MPLAIESLTHTIADGADERCLFKELNLTIGQGECVALMGDSGSGKTTLLNLIAGLEPIQQGDIRISGQSLSQATEQRLSEIRKSQIGIIFQQFNLLTSINVEANIAFSARLTGRYDQELCRHFAHELGISHLLSKYPATLSGGEMQRVAIARALSAQPKLLLADEPTGNLDKTNSEHVVEQLTNLSKRNQTALLLVTHSGEVARQMDKTYLLQAGHLSLSKV